MSLFCFGSSSPYSLGRTLPEDMQRNLCRCGLISARAAPQPFPYITAPVLALQRYQSRSASRPYVQTAPKHAESTDTTSKGIQTWQAFFLGSIAVIAIQGLVLYSGALQPASRSNNTGGQIGRSAADLEKALQAIRDSDIEVSTAEDVLSGYATAPGTSYPASLPLAAVYPTSTEDVVTIVHASRMSRIRKASSSCDFLTLTNSSLQQSCPSADVLLSKGIPSRCKKKDLLFSSASRRWTRFLM